MKQDIYKITENSKLVDNVYRMILVGDTSAITAPGQFVNIKLDGFYLRRPISICDYSNNSITIIYKVVGDGTEKMAEMSVGEELDVLVGLGNGFNVDDAGNSPVVIGGGVGVPPMYRLCRDLVAMGKSVKVILGFNKKSEVFYEQEFKDLGCEVYVTTVDGSYGEKGFVTDVLKKLSYSYFYTCGPIPMLKAIDSVATSSGQLSFEERMGCGFGACMGCSCKTKYGNKRICKDGPVLVREEIIW